MTAPEKKLLEAILERGLGVQRRKPAGKRSHRPLRPKGAHLRNRWQRSAHLRSVTKVRFEDRLGVYRGVPALEGDSGSKTDEGGTGASSVATALTPGCYWGAEIASDVRAIPIGCTCKGWQTCSVSQSLGQN
jgi:hypothetical protein